MASARPYYTKFHMAGFAGEKEAVLIPDDMVIDSKSMSFIMKCLKMKPPNLLIEGTGSSVHPMGLLNEKEMSLLAAQGVIGKQVDGKEDLVRKVLFDKLNAITSAILLALRETESATFSFSTFMTSFDISCARALDSLGGSVPSFSTFHFNDEAISEPRSKEMIKQLLDGCVPLDLNTKESQHQSIRLDGKWLADAMSRPWEGHSALEVNSNSLLPPAERKPTSQWCNPLAQTFFFFFTRKTHTEKEFNENHEVAMNCDLLSERALIAPPGMVFFGGTTECIKGLYSRAFEKAVPTVIIKYTGGLSNIYAELLTSLSKIIRDDSTELSLVVEKEHQPQVSKANGRAEIAKRLGLVSPALFLAKAYKNSAQDENAAVRVTVADVVHLLDMAKARPQVFLQTIQVIDPLTHSQSQALDILSECISSTYTGLVSLGASSDDVLREAWVMKTAFDNRSQRLRLLYKAFEYTTAILAWCALLFASFQVQFDSCYEKIKDSDSSAGQLCDWFMSQMPTCGHTTISAAVILAPIITAFVTTLKSHFRYREKWATAKMAGEEIESHIFQFRASTGPYAKRSAFTGEDADDESDNLPADGLSRHRLSGNLQKIYVQALSTDLNSDFVLLDPEAAAPVPQDTCTCWCWRRQQNENPAARQEISGGDYFALTDNEPGTLRPVFQSGSAQDDGVSPLTGDEYYALRFLKLKASYLSAAPNLARAHQFMNVWILFGGCVASLLGAYRKSAWIPVVVGFTGMLQHLTVVHNSSAELASINRTLSGLQSTSVQWKALSRMDRRAPRFKEQMVTLTEQQHMGVVQTQTGVGMLLQGGREDPEDTEEHEQKGKTDKKAKAKNSRQVQKSK